MPKYYVRDGNGCHERAVVSASNPLIACVIAVDKFFNSFSVGGWYWVSECGFSPHLEDVKIFSNDVNEELVKIWKERADES